MTCIVTLRLDPAAQAHFNNLRLLHYPPERNYIDAHVTLFHTLPDEPFVAEKLEAESRFRAAFEAGVTGLRSLGHGVAYWLESPELQALHKDLAVGFAEYLSPQDRQRFQPHIVVQNKVSAEAARALLEELRAGFTTGQIQATGLSLWHYRGGPWKLAGSFSFR